MLRPRGGGDAARALPGDQGPVRIQPDDFAGVRGQNSLQARLRQKDRSACVSEHEGQPFLWVLRVHGHVGPPGFEYPQQPHHHLQRALHANAHQRVRPNPQPLQIAGQLVGPLIELTVRELLAFKNDGCGIRRALDLLLNQFVQTPAPGIFDPRLIPLHQQLPPFSFIEDGKHGDGLIWIAQHSFDQAFPMAQPASHGGSIEQVNIKSAADAKVFTGVHRLNVEIKEVKALPRPNQFRAGQSQTMIVAAEVKDQRHQRHAAGIARQVQFLDQAAEGVVLVLVGVKDQAVDLLQVLAERLVAVALAANRKQADTMADKGTAPRVLLGVNGHLSRRMDAHNQVSFAGEPVEQYFQTGEEIGEERATLRRGGLLQRAIEFWTQDQFPAVSPVGLEPRTRPVGGQFNGIRRAGELTDPVGFRLREAGAILREGLPLKVVAELHGGSKAVGSALNPGGIECAQLPEQHTY